MKPVLLTGLLAIASVAGYADDATVNISANFRNIAVVQSGSVSGTISGTQIIRDDEPKQIIINKNKILILYK